MQICLSCPIGGFCGGGVEESRIVAKKGFARLFHNTSIPIFVPCSTDKVFTSPDLCNGVNLDNETSGVPCIDHGKKSVLEMYNGGCDRYGLRKIETCNIGYGGFLCSECIQSPRYFRKAQTTCTKCLENSSLYTAAVLGAIAVVVVLGVLIWRKLASSDTGNAAEDVILLKVASNHSQFLSMVASFPLSFPKWLEALFDGMKVASATNPEDVGLECYVNTNMSNFLYPLNRSPFYLMVFGILISPLIIAFFLFVYWVFHLFICRTILRKPANETFLRHLRKNVSVSLVVTFFLILPLLTKNTLGLFSCTPVEATVANGVTYNQDWLTGANDTPQYKNAGNIWNVTRTDSEAGTTTFTTYRLIGDPSVTCYDKHHYYIWVSMGIPAMILYILGIPLFGAFFTWRLRRQDLRWKAQKKKEKKDRRKNKREQKRKGKKKEMETKVAQTEDSEISKRGFSVKQEKSSWLHPFEFLRDGYKDTKWGWETVTMIRKILMNIVWILTVSLNQVRLLFDHL